jgi:hypothetical protein
LISNLRGLICSFGLIAPANFTRPAKSVEGVQTAQASDILIHEQSNFTFNGKQARQSDGAGIASEDYFDGIYGSI